MATRRRAKESIVTEETVVVETKDGRTTTTTKRTSTSNIPSSRPSSTAFQQKTITSNDPSKRPVTMYSTTDFSRRPLSMNLTDFDSKVGSTGTRSRPLSGNFSKFENKSNEPPKAKSSRPLSRLFGGKDKKPAAAEPRPKVRPLSTNFSAVNQKSGGGGTGGAGGTNKPAQRPYSMFDTKQGQKQVPLQTNRTTKQPPSSTQQKQSALPSKPSFLTSPFKKSDPHQVSPSSTKRPQQEKPAKPSLEDFKRDILTAHNEYRSKHPGTPLLIWSDDLTNQAQAWCTRMAENDQMQHAPAPNRPGQGENLAGAWGEPMTGRKATDQWYNEISNYNFSDPKKSKSPVGHFTQVVWKGSTQMGAAMATSASGWNFVVARYRAAGNMRGAEKMNVMPLN